MRCLGWELTDPRLGPFCPMHPHDRSKRAGRQQVGRHDYLLLVLNFLICPDDVWKLPAKSTVYLRVNLSFIGPVALLSD